MDWNLMAIPWTERDAPPGFGYAGGFQDILTAYNGLNHRGDNVRYHDNQQLLQYQIIHLTNLKKELEEDEDECPENCFPEYCAECTYYDSKTNTCACDD